MNRRLPVADWPARDRELWEDATKPGDLFGGGAGGHWATATKANVACGYNAWLLWLDSQKLLDRSMQPVDRVTPERVANYVAAIRAELAPYSVLARIHGLLSALRVMEPQSDWGWLREVRQNLKAQVRPTRDKLSRLQQPDVLMALGEQLMDEADASRQRSAKRRAVLYRDGLIIAALAYRPVRRKNLAMMRLGQHLIKVGGLWRIAFAAEETKTHVAYEAAFPTALASRLERYLDLYRPILLDGELVDGDFDAAPTRDHDALWVSEDGIPLAYEAIAYQIVGRTRRAFGRSVSPHLFRDCAATAVAVENPKHIGDAPLILGHADHKTTEKHYNHAMSLEASRRHSAVLASLGERLKKSRN